MGLDPGKLNQISTKSLRAACPKDNILFLLLPDTGAKVLSTCIYLIGSKFHCFWILPIVFFAILEKILIKDANKTSHELKHTK